MSWLLRLYPPGWRRRYGDELRELIETQSVSMSLVVDLVAGAIDAWIHPQFPASGHGPNVERGGKPMVARMLQLKCAGYGAKVTAADAGKSLAVLLGGTLTLTVFWLWLVSRMGSNPYLTALSPLAYFIPLLVSLKFTSLKGRSATVQAIFIFGQIAVLVALFLGAAWLGSRI